MEATFSTSKINNNTRSAARRQADAASYVPVYIIDEPGFFASEEGRRGHWTTPAGNPVRYPNAYRKAFGRPVYHCSTLRVEVGVDWRPPARSVPRWAVNGCP